MSHVSRTYGPMTGKLICPDGREYELKEVHLTWTTELQERPAGPEPGSPIAYQRATRMIFEFKE